LIQYLDGKTSNDHTFSGPIGKELSNIVKLDINLRFQPVTVGPPLIELEQEIIDDLSTYGYRIVMAIRAGMIPKDLANLEMGPVCHSRWLTTANRLLRLYVSTHGFQGKTLPNIKLIV
jgi:hypothetical protein